MTDVSTETRDERPSNIDAEISPPPNILLSGIIGSTAYGLAHEGSDIDRIGTYAAPTSAFHGLHLPVGKAATWVSSKPDATFHEAGKLVALLLKANPTVTELLWLDRYEVTTPEGRALIAIRQSFLSATAARNAYLGYAEGQFKRLENRGDGSFSADTRKRTAKHARHLWRLVSQCGQLWGDGVLTVRLEGDDVMYCREFGEKVAAGDLDVARQLLYNAGCTLEATPCALPARPDEAAAEAWLQDVRRIYWEQP
jgi:hypothetical protein